LTDAVSLVSNPAVYDSFKKYAELTSNHFMVKMIDGIYLEYQNLSAHPLSYIRDSLDTVFSRKASWYKAKLFADDRGINFNLNVIGQLAEKEEAAGKVRVFAIVDG